MANAPANSARVRKTKVSELSSREDFIVNSFADMKKINTLASKLFQLYFVDVDRNSELSPMMRTMVPAYYVDPSNPEHPSCYILAGRSLVDYVERIVFVAPYVDEKGKYVYDLSGWKGLLFNPAEFQLKVKGFRKSKLEPLVVMGERNGERFNQSLILREDTSKAREELIIPFLQTPNRKRDGEEAYQQALQTLIYDPNYRYVMHYLRGSLPFLPIPEETIQEMLETGMTEFWAQDQDRVQVTKDLFPTAKADQHFSIAKVPNPEVDTSGGVYHYVIAQEYLNERQVSYLTIYTLVAALQVHEYDDELLTL